MLKNIDVNREHITTPEAAQRSGLSRIYIARLLREGTLEGFQVGRDWVVYTDSLEKFLDTPRKPGPKGPRKKQLEPEHSATTSRKNESDNS